MRILWILLLLSYGADLAEAKRVLMPPTTSAEDPLVLSSAELRSLGERVGAKLAKCKAFPRSNKYYFYVFNKTGRTVDTEPVKAGLTKKLSAQLGMIHSVRIEAELSFREWKSGKYLFTYTLEAKAFKGGEKICTVLHRTVRKRKKF